MKKAFDYATEQRICGEYKVGANSRELARKYGVCHETVLNILERHGKPRRTISEAKREFDDETEHRICEEYKQGSNIRVLSEKYHVSTTPIRRVLKRHGAPRRPPTEAGRRYYVDHAHFNTVDTPGKAYWLGFIFADGCLQPKARHASAILEVALAMRDRAHLQKILDEHGSNYPIYDNVKREHPASLIRIISDQLVEDLHRHGVSYPREQPRSPDISPELYSHFIRGYWDGDGSIQRWKRGQWVWDIVGQKQFLEVTQSMLVKECSVRRTKITKIERNSNVYKLVYVGNRQVPRIVEWMYSGADSPIWLDRKKNKAGGMFVDINARGVGPNRTRGLKH